MTKPRKTGSTKHTLQSDSTHDKPGLPSKRARVQAKSTLKAASQKKPKKGDLTISITPDEYLMLSLYIVTRSSESKSTAVSQPKSLTHRIQPPRPQTPDSGDNSSYNSDGEPDHDVPPQDDIDILEDNDNFDDSDNFDDNANDNDNFDNNDINSGARKSLKRMAHILESEVSTIPIPISLLLIFASYQRL